MPQSNQPPCISQETVRAALDGLLYSPSERNDTCIENLHLVDQVLSRPEFPHSSHSRKFALQEILVLLIVEELTNHRLVYGIQLPELDNDQKSVYAAIAEDTRTANPELIGWSWLYHHYVRFDLNISISDFSEMMSLDERTLRRYQTNTIWRLMSRLLHDERKLQAEKRKSILYSKLPTPAHINLFGRAAEFHRFQQALKGLPPTHFQVTGDAGVGKTVLVQEAVRQQIDAGKIDYLIWIEEPRSVDQIMGQIVRAMRSDMSGFSLRDYAAQYEICLVLDNLEYLRDDLANVECLLADLSTELVYLSNRAYMPLDYVSCHILLDELHQDDAFLMIHSILSNHFHAGDTQGLDDLAYAVWNRAGGNPYQIKQAIHAFHENDVRNIH